MLAPSGALLANYTHQPSTALTTCGSSVDSAAVDCTRLSIMATLSGLTLLLCLFHIIRLIRHIKTVISHQLVILYIVLTQMSLLFLHYLVFDLNILAFSAAFLAVLAYSVVCYFFTSLACRTVRRVDMISKYVRPIFALIFVFVVVVFILATLDYYHMTNTAQPADWDCRNPFWLTIEVTSFCLTLMFVISGYAITKTFYSIAVSSSLRARKLRELWTLICVNFFTSSVSLVYGIYIFMLNQESTGCHMLVGHPYLRVVFYLLIRATVNFFPVWAVLYVFFKLTPRAPVQSSTGQPKYTVFNPQQHEYIPTPRTPRDPTELPSEASE